MAHSPDPWRRSITEERRRKRDPGDPRRRITAGEALLVAAVLAAVLAYAIWFFFLSDGTMPTPGIGPG
jgi:hypothetical protein